MFRPLFFHEQKQRPKHIVKLRFERTEHGNIPKLYGKRCLSFNSYLSGFGFLCFDLNKSVMI